MGPAGPMTVAIFRAETVRLAVAVCVEDADVPVTVMVAVPPVVNVLTTRVRVELPPAVTEAGLNEPVTPGGKPETARLTFSATPLVRAVVIVKVVVAP